MHTILISAFLLLAGAGCARNSLTGRLSAAALDDMAERYKFFVVLEEGEGHPFRYLYADHGLHLHAYVVHNGRPQLEWEKTDLDSPVSAMLFGDLGKRGNTVVLVATVGGRILAFDPVNFNLLFENLEEQFARISCVVAANIDDDPQDELLIIGRTLNGGDFCLHVYDVLSRTLQWKAGGDCNATELLVANVDKDPQLEIILNSGSIIDSRFRNTEINKIGTGGFGNNMRLLDLNGDGYPEVIGEVNGFAVKIFDIHSQVEIW
jgi:hypothetical protein